MRTRTPARLTIIGEGGFGMAGQVGVRVDGGTRTVLSTPVYETLKERIMDQALPPGSRLNIDALALSLGVSQTPIREALVRLAAERLIAFVPYKGYSVTPLPTHRQIADMMHVRQLLEQEAARLAAARCTAADLRHMERELKRMEALHPTPRFRDFRTYTHHDRCFHEALAAASDNAVLLEAFRGLNVHVQLARFVHDIGEVDYRENMVEHREIFDGITARDGERAAAALALHIGRFEQTLSKNLDAHLASAPRPRRVNRERVSEHDPSADGLGMPPRRRT
jgi:DNA-binding GntR family transcriptional regulator